MSLINEEQPPFGTDDNLSEYLVRMFRDAASSDDISDQFIVNTALPNKPITGKLYYFKPIAGTQIYREGFYWYVSSTQTWEYMGVSDFFFDVSAGKVEGHDPYTVTSQSENLSTSYFDLWERASVYQYSATADIKNIVSANAADTGTMIVMGLDVGWNPQTFEVTLNGTTPVDWTSAPAGSHPALIRMIKIIAGDTAIAGDVTVYIDGGSAAVDADVRAEAWVEHQTSLMGIFPIPAGKTGYIVYGKTSVSENKAMHLHFDVGNGENQSPFITAHPIFLYQDNYDYFFKLAGKIPEKTDIRVQGLKSGGGAGTGFGSAAFDVILVDNI